MEPSSGKDKDKKKKKKAEEKASPPQQVAEIDTAKYPDTIKAGSMKFTRCVIDGDKVCYGPSFNPEGLKEHLWKAKWDPTKERLFFTNIADKTKRVWKLPSMDVAAVEGLKSSVTSPEKKEKKKKEKKEKKIEKGLEEEEEERANPWRHQLVAQQHLQEEGDVAGEEGEDEHQKQKQQQLEEENEEEESEEEGRGIMEAAEGVKEDTTGEATTITAVDHQPQVKEGVENDEHEKGDESSPPLPQPSLNETTDVTPDQTPKKDDSTTPQEEKLKKKRGLERLTDYGYSPKQVEALRKTMSLGGGHGRGGSNDSSQPSPPQQQYSGGKNTPDRHEEEEEEQAAEPYLDNEEEEKHQEQLRKDKGDDEEEEKATHGNVDVEGGGLFDARLSVAEEASRSTLDIIEGRLRSGETTPEQKQALREKLSGIKQQMAAAQIGVEKMEIEREEEDEVEVEEGSTEREREKIAVVEEEAKEEVRPPQRGPPPVVHSSEHFDEEFQRRQQRRQDDEEQQAAMELFLHTFSTSIDHPEVAERLSIQREEAGERSSCLEGPFFSGVADAHNAYERRMARLKSAVKDCTQHMEDEERDREDIAWTCQQQLEDMRIHFLQKSEEIAKYEKAAERERIEYERGGDDDGVKKKQKEISERLERELSERTARALESQRRKRASEGKSQVLPDSLALQLSAEELEGRKMIERAMMKERVFMQPPSLADAPQSALAKKIAGTVGTMLHGVEEEEERTNSKLLLHRHSDDDNVVDPVIEATLSELWQRDVSRLYHAALDKKMLDNATFCIESISMYQEFVLTAPAAKVTTEPAPTKSDGVRNRGESVERETMTAEDDFELLRKERAKWEVKEFDTEGTVHSKLQLIAEGAELLPVSPEFKQAAAKTSHEQQQEEQQEKEVGVARHAPVEVDPEDQQQNMPQRQQWAKRAQPPPDHIVPASLEEQQHGSPPPLPPPPSSPPPCPPQEASARPTAATPPPVEEEETVEKWDILQRAREATPRPLPSDGVKRGPPTRRILTPRVPRELRNVGVTAPLLPVGFVASTPSPTLNRQQQQQMLQTSHVPPYYSSVAAAAGAATRSPLPRPFPSLEAENSGGQANTPTPPPPHEGHRHHDPSSLPTTPPAAATPTPRQHRVRAPVMLQWDVKRSGNVVLARDNTAAMADSSAPGGVASCYTPGGHNYCAIGTIGISKGELVFEVRYDQHPSAVASSGARRFFIGMASKYFRGKARQCPAYMLRSDGFLVTHSADERGVPYMTTGVPSGSVVSVHLNLMRWEMTFHVNGVSQGVAFKFPEIDNPEPLFPAVIFSGEGDCCVFKPPSASSLPTYATPPRGSGSGRRGNNRKGEGELPAVPLSGQLTA